MKIIIKETNLSVNDAIKDYIEEKIGGLRKFIAEADFDLAVARVEIGRTTFHHQKGGIFRAEVNLSLPGRLLRAEAEKDDIFMAITAVKGELGRQIDTYKERLTAKRAKKRNKR